MSVKLWVEKTMSYRSGVVSLVMGLAVAAAGMLTHMPADAQTGIAATRHNLGSGSNSITGRNQFSGTAEICVFCHTPHGADTAAAVPLWNRTLGKDSSGAAVTYTTYDQLGTSTLRGTVLGVGSVSIACLSCHDGTQAMNSVLNAPGSGTAWSGAAGTWSGTNVDTGTGKLSSGVITNIGADLRNDHPVGIQYAGGGYKAGAGTVPTLVSSASPEFNAAVKDSAKDVWWVDTTGGTAGTREKSDLMLYTRVNGTVTEPFVECASCHDPHTTQTTFLRISNAGSAVCLACHIK